MRLGQLSALILTIELLPLACVAGCGSAASEHMDARKLAYAAYGEGLKALGAYNYQAAERQFAIALDHGALNPDIACDARIRRAVCLAALGKVDQAHSTLTELEKLRADNRAQIYAARSFVYARQEKTAEAQVAHSKARQLNPAVDFFD